MAYDYPEDLKEEFPEKYSEESKFDFLSEKTPSTK